MNIVVTVLFVLEVDIQRVLLQSELCTQYIFILIKYMFLGNGIGIFWGHEEGDQLAVFCWQRGRGGGGCVNISLCEAHILNPRPQS